MQVERAAAIATLEAVLGTFGRLQHLKCAREGQVALAEMIEELRQSEVAPNLSEVSELFMERVSLWYEYGSFALDDATEDARTWADAHTGSDKDWAPAERRKSLLKASKLKAVHSEYERIFAPLVLRA